MDCSVDSAGRITSSIGSGLAEGTYSLQLVWVKNWMRPYVKGGGFANPDHSSRSDCFTLTRKDMLFTITNQSSEAEVMTGSTALFRFRTSAASYGYDGLSAWEVAVMRGTTTLPEDEWVANLSEMNARFSVIRTEWDNDVQGSQRGIKQRAGDAISSMQSVESSVEAAESSRVSAESSRVSAEAVRSSYEAARVSAEAQRASTASSDHSTAALDHSTASSDHSTASLDHSIAVQDHANLGARVSALEADAVRSVEQSLTDAQKRQARSNIGAQSVLVFDSAPTEGSMNPVTSGGLKARFDEIESHIFPLTVSLSVESNLLEYTGVSVSDIVYWSVARSGASVAPDTLNLKVNGSTVWSVPYSSGSYSASLNTLGSVPISISVTKGSLSASKSVSVEMVKRMYFGFSGDSITDPTSLVPQQLKSSPAGSYTLTNPAQGKFLWLCVGGNKAIARVTSSGFEVPMSSFVEVGGYRCYRSSSPLAAGPMSFTVQ